MLLDQVSSSAAQGTSGLHMILLLTAGRCHYSQSAAIAQLIFCCVQDCDIARQTASSFVAARSDYDVVTTKQVTASSAQAHQLCYSQLAVPSADPLILL